MKCPKCGSDNVSVQVVTETKMVDQHHSFLWWICVGWWWLPFKWLFLTLPALIVKLIRQKRQKVIQNSSSQCVCQNCGHVWKA